MSNLIRALIAYIRNSAQTSVIPTPIAISFAIFVALILVVIPEPVVQSSFIATTTTQVPITTTTTTTTTIPEPPVPVAVVKIRPTTTTTTIPYPEGKCSEWYPTAYQAGWPLEDLPKLGRIMWAESNCIHDIANKTYSYGLVQIEWSAHKNWLKTEFNITEREALYDPYTNLLVARWLYNYAQTHYGCGWQPWYMSGSWC